MRGTGNVDKQKEILLSSVFYQASAETPNTGKSATGGECTEGHGDVT